MSNLTRWGNRGTVSLRDAMDQLLEDSFVRFGDFPLGNLSGAGAPMVNVFETNDNVVVQAAVPGIKPEEIDITLTGDVLSIKGEIKQEQDKKEGSYHRQEWRRASFERSFTLPCSVNAEKVHSEYENGVLTLTLPKADAVKPRRLQIKAK